MLAPLLLGSLALIFNLGIQVAVILLAIRYLLGRLHAHDQNPSYATGISMLSIVLGMLFAGHLLQFATWAILFVAVGEFAEWETAFYHSAVNFTSLGYGDIVMSPRWRLLGALEAANGVLMFGLTASSMMALMARLFALYSEGAGSRNDRSA